MALGPNPVRELKQGRNVVPNLSPFLPHCRTGSRTSSTHMFPVQQGIQLIYWQGMMKKNQGMLMGMQERKCLSKLCFLIYGKTNFFARLLGSSRFCAKHFRPRIKWLVCKSSNKKTKEEKPNLQNPAETFLLCS